MEYTIRFALKRDGTLIAPPRMTYASHDAPAAMRDIYRTAIDAALKRCTPLHFSMGMAGAVAGRPIAIRFVDERTIDDKPKSHPSITTIVGIVAPAGLLPVGSSAQKPTTIFGWRSIWCRHACGFRSINVGCHWAWSGLPYSSARTDRPRPMIRTFSSLLHRSPSMSPMPKLQPWLTTIPVRISATSKLSPPAASWIDSRAASVEIDRPSAPHMCSPATCRLSDSRPHALSHDREFESAPFRVLVSWHNVTTRAVTGWVGSTAIAA